MEKGAATLKRVFLELGGKSATIVLDDADFATSVPSGVQVCFHAGQGCAIQTRMLLPRSRYDEGVEILKATLGSVAYGDPQRPDVLMGPVISAKQRERVLGYIEKGVAEGATLALGGGRPADLPRGWFVEPTLFTDVDNSMTIAQEEIFGPVLVAIPYDDDDDAVRIANDSVYGLSGGVFSGSLERALGVAERIRTGQLLRQRRHADRAGRHALRRLQAQRHRAAERARRLRPVSRAEVGGLADPPIAHSLGLGGAAMSDHGSALREHGYHELRVKAVVAETHDASSFVLDVPPELAEIFRYRPGQFCTFRVHIDGEEQLRSYSMSSAPETDDDADRHGQAGHRRPGLKLVPRQPGRGQRRGGDPPGRCVLPTGVGAAGRSGSAVAAGSPPSCRSPSTSSPRRSARCGFSTPTATANR